MTLWEFSKFFFPYLFLLTGFVLVIAGLSDIGYVPASPTCTEWRQANHEYATIVSASTVPLPDLQLLRFSNACGLWKTWFSFAIMSIFLYFTLLIWPMAFTVGRRFMFISMEIVAGVAVFNSIMTFLFVLLFFLIGGAWEWKFQCSSGNPPVCGFYDDGVAFPLSPAPDQLPWLNTSEAFRNILVDPKFFARYALVKYGTQDTIMTCIGAFFGALGAVLLVLLQNDLNKKWEPVGAHPVQTPGNTTQASTPSKPTPPVEASVQAPPVALFRSVHTTTTEL